jgi:sodium/bile acid cotransporter 7
MNAPSRLSKNRLLRLLATHWFLIALFAALVAGSNASRHLGFLTSRSELRDGIVFGVMFLMALSLDTGALLGSLRRPGPALLATAVSYGLLPLMAALASRLLADDLAAGLIVVSATPCTLASATVWTGRARGNEVAALMTTILTNSICFLATPLIVWLALGRTATIPAAELSLKLLLLVVLPVVLGQVARSIPGVAPMAKARKSLLGTLAQFGVLTMVLIGIAKTWNSLPGGTGFPWLAAVRVAGICLTIHLAAMAAGFWIAGKLRMARADRIAVGIAGSQKTLMAGIVVCLLLGVSLVPMIVYHVVQLVVDTLIADRMAAGSERAAVPLPPA